jgi:hypothetical protein
LIDGVLDFRHVNLRNHVEGVLLCHNPDATYEDAERPGSSAAFIAVATGYLLASWKLTPTNPAYLVSLQMILPYA